MICDNWQTLKLRCLVLIVVGLARPGAPLEEVRCGGMDIRNDPTWAQIHNSAENMSMNISSCTVMEGDFSLTMVTDSNTTADAFPVFSKLREINGYVLIFHVTALESLGRIFPELRVIRGRNLLLNYALVVYQNSDLRELGLTKLVEISHGGVRIAENTELCYADKINWKNLMKSVVNDQLIEGNNDLCPDKGYCEPSGDRDVCQRMLTDMNEYSCWNRKDCLKVCDCESGCYGPKNEKCCHEQCAGSCTGPTDADCVACKNVWHSGRCLPECPKELYLLLPAKRRCVSRDQCMNRTAEETDFQKQTFWKAMNRTCSTECPVGFIEDEKDPYTCKECSTWCPKKCMSLTIDAIGHAEKAKGCNIITGSLIIRLHTGFGENAGAKLEEALSDLQEVDDYVAVFFSPSLVSLNLFKNLKRIRGKNLYTNRYALSVFENENLRQLLPGNQTLHIDNGVAQFHNNPMLCYSRITELLRNIVPKSDKPISNEDISGYSNGNKAVCAEEHLHLEIQLPLSNGFIVEWEAFNTTNLDHRKFLGYQIFYKEISGPDEVIDIDANRDACYDSWQMEFEESAGSGEDETTRGSLIGSELKPFTWYAVYVRTLLVNHPGVRGGISDIVYVQTLFEAPSPPRDVDSTSVTADSITLTWDEPLNPKGQVTHYKVQHKRVRQNDELAQRNYCEQTAPAIATATKKTPKPTMATLLGVTPSSDTCASHSCCDCGSEQQQSQDSVPDTAELREKREKIEFENAIHNKIFYQRCDIDPTQEWCKRQRKNSKLIKIVLSSSERNNERPVRRKRSIDEPEAPTKLEEEETIRNTSDTDTNSTDATPTTAAAAGAAPEFGFDVKVQNVSVPEIQLKNLHHFSDYEIRIWACQNRSAPENFCSELAAFHKERTAAIKEKDVVHNVRVSNETGTSRFISWEPPLDPNGVVLSYIIFIKDSSSDKETVQKCVTPTELAENGGKQVNLWGGHFIAKVRAHSLAGMGEWSATVTFEIESQAVVARHVVILLSVLLPLLAIGIAGIIAWYVYRRKMKKLPEYLIDMITANPDYISTLDVYQPDEWELARDDIELLSEIGHGTFGKVFAGRGKNVKSQCGLTFGDCAVKTVADSATHYDRLHFLVEASVMKSFNTAFIVKLYGVVSNGQPALVVMEMMDKGNLRDYLRSRRLNSEENVEGLPQPTLQETLTWAAQIADGMAYLEHQKFCHRDLAARNCMVSANESCKIGDFGMARDVYVKDYYRPTGKRLMPVRWMGPESLKDAKFTSKSDVWSYGVVLWEMVTLAQQPYPGLSNEDVFKFIVESSGTMTCERFSPTGCPELFLQMMKMCWKHDPRDRPSFGQLVEMLLPSVEDDFREVSFCCNRDQAGAIERKTASSFPRSAFGSQPTAAVSGGTGAAPVGPSNDGGGSQAAPGSEGTPSELADSDTPLNGEGTQDLEAVALNIGGADSDRELRTPVCSYNRRDNPTLWPRKQSPISDSNDSHVEAARALSNSSANGHVHPVPV